MRPLEVIWLSFSLLCFLDPALIPPPPPSLSFSFHAPPDVPRRDHTSCPNQVMAPQQLLPQLAACAFELCLSLVSDSPLSALLPAAAHARLARLASAVRSAADERADAAGWLRLCEALREGEASGD